MDDIVARPPPTTEQIAQRFEFAVKLGELARLWRGQIDRHLRPLDLSFLQWQTLTQLARADEYLVQKDLAAAVGMEGPTMVGVLDRLVERDLVKRRVAAHDRRANTVHLTDAGIEILRLAEAKLHELRDVLLADLSGEELDICIRVFGHVSVEARAFGPELAEAAVS